MVRPVWVNVADGVDALSDMVVIEIGTERGIDHQEQNVILPRCTVAPTVVILGGAVVEPDDFFKNIDRSYDVGIQPQVGDPVLDCEDADLVDQLEQDEFTPEKDVR